MIGTGLTFQLCEISVVGVVALGRAFDELEECAQVFAFSRLKLREFDTNAKRWAAFGDDSGQDQSL